MDPSLQALLKEHPSLSLNERGKVHCSLTGHDMPAKVDAVKAYVAGKAYQHRRQWYSADFSKYEPYIRADRKDPLKLFCRLTRQQLNRIPEEVSFAEVPRFFEKVEAHVSGRRYKLRLAEAEARKAAGRDPFAVATEEAGDDDDDMGAGFDGEEEEGDIVFEPLDDDEEEGSKKGGKKGVRFAAAAASSDDADEDETEDDDGNGMDEDDEGIEIDEEFFAGNDAALAAAGLIKPKSSNRRWKKGKTGDGPKKFGGKGAPSSSSSSSSALTGKREREGAGAGAGGDKKRKAKL